VVELELTKLVDGRQMAEIDRRTIEEHGIAGADLMERAGREVVEEIANRWDGLDGLRVVVVCGKGNNGGDGYVVARLLRTSGAAVRLFLLAQREDVGGDAAHHMALLEGDGGKVEPLEEGDNEEFVHALTAADIVVDALLGTGLRDAPRPLISRAIECMNDCGRPLVAVDIPSGVDAGTGRTPGTSVRAVLTVTFGLPKVGHLFYPGRSRCGALHLADIGFPAEVLRSTPSVAHLLDRATMAALLPRRQGDAHKGSCGSVVVVAGSVGMTGAAALAADAALRAGAGRVSLGVPASLNDILEVKLTEVMTSPLPEVKRRRCLALRALGEIEALMKGADCLALGPGLGRYRETTELVRRLVQRAEVPLVLDADGLNACVGATGLFKRRTAATVLTPHVGEFARLSTLSKDEIIADPIGVSRTFALEHEVVLVLKGAPSVVAWPDGTVAVNTTGNPGMATAGSGDVLTGLVAGFIAQGMSAENAAALAVFAHGAAGDRARDCLGEWSVLAKNIAAEVAKTLLELASQ
jgi:hydroxyethylthiazole kinase-like uncharacterized protein yjeF